MSDELASQMQAQVGEDYRWHGHRVMKVDGTTVSMPDTPGLQKAFPQPDAQKRGCGFPIARLVVLFSWATGAVIREVAGNLHESENNLFRAHYADWLEPGDVVLGDRYYCSYVDLARLREQGMFVVYRLHHCRPADFRTGRPLGKDDRLVTWRRPEKWFPSFGISRENFERLPETLTVRMIRISQVPKGFRSQTVVVVTTLLDPVAYPAAEIGDLYRDRWTVELAIDELKTHESERPVLRTQTPAGVVQEIYGLMLGHYVLRTLMHEAAKKVVVSPLRISFVGTLKILRCRLPECPQSPPARQRWWRNLLEEIAEEIIPERRNRINPRVIKRKMSNWLKKRPEHYHWPQPTKQFRRSIVMRR